MKEENYQSGDSRAKGNEDGCGWQRLKQIGNDDFEKFSPFFFKIRKGDIAPLSTLVIAISLRGTRFLVTAAYASGC